MSDFCYSRPMLDRVFRQAELMDRVMERLGVDPAMAARVERGMAVYEARTKCISCSHERECRHWLEGSVVRAGPADFCPNADFMRYCADVRR